MTVPHHSEPAREAVRKLEQDAKERAKDGMLRHAKTYSPAQLLSVIAALSTHPTSAATRGEPVAWMCHDLILNDIVFSRDAEHCARRAARKDEWRVEPLYAAPPAPAVESAQVKEAGPLLGSRLNHAALTIRGLSERIALMRESYTSNSALDHGRRQILDDFEKFLRSRASLAPCWPPSLKLTRSSTMVDEKALTVDALAQEIRRVDGNHSLGAGALAEALMPFITGALSPGSTGETEGCGPISDEPLEALSHARTTAANDDMSKPGTVERKRHCQRLAAMQSATAEIVKLRAMLSAAGER